jgi:hypothetical protein
MQRVEVEVLEDQEIQEDLVLRIKVVMEEQVLQIVLQVHQYLMLVVGVEWDMELEVQLLLILEQEGVVLEERVHFIILVEEMQQQEQLTLEVVEEEVLYLVVMAQQAVRE